MLPADGSSTRGGSTSVRGRVRSPHIPAAGQLQAARAPTVQAGTDRRTDRLTGGSRYRLRRGIILTDRALTVLVSLQPVNTKYAV